MRLRAAILNAHPGTLANPGGQHIISYPRNAETLKGRAYDHLGHRPAQEDAGRQRAPPRARPGDVPGWPPEQARQAVQEGRRHQQDQGQG
eukprot:8454340-Pyramimonas_sp.AAC.1